MLRPETVRFFWLVGWDAACTLCLQAKQHRQDHCATTAVSKLQPLKKKCVDIRGTPYEGYTVIAVDQCTHLACGLGVATKSSDDTLSFM